MQKSAGEGSHTICAAQRNVERMVITLWRELLAQILKGRLAMGKLLQPWSRVWQTYTTRPLEVSHCRSLGDVSCQCSFEKIYTASFELLNLVSVFTRRDFPLIKQPSPQISLPLFLTAPNPDHDKASATKTLVFTATPRRIVGSPTHVPSSSGPNSIRGQQSYLATTTTTQENTLHYHITHLQDHITHSATSPPPLPGVTQ
ncbi:hypothetical protein DFS34DRAFT_153854 [Phlyctochytrium arcticum]|nr:hypothetical protein DFS34DRAFT_153854 [Phlyctochytrium arcticum]